MLEQIQHRENLEEWQKKSLFPYWLLPKNKKLQERARELRKQGIFSEVKFWNYFKISTNTHGYDIDRQVIIGHYIVDFFIAELGLVVEIDGSSHDYKEEYDAIRNDFLVYHDLKVIHYLDNDVKTNFATITIDFKQKIIEREKHLKSIIINHE
jgi:very-short-patch-repair endonuclease